MNFAIFGDLGLMAINGVVLAINTSSLPAGQSRVMFNDDDGQYQTSGLLPINIPISDPSPYQTCVNNWLTAAESITFTATTTTSSNTLTFVSSQVNLVVGMAISGTGIPNGTTITALNGGSITMSANATANGTITVTGTGISLAQAKQIKSNLVNTIYDYKRQEPFTFTLSASFTANMSRSSVNLTKVSSTAGVNVGMTLTGTNIPAGTTVTAISGSTITMSAGPTATANNVSVTATAPSNTTVDATDESVAAMNQAFCGQVSSLENNLVEVNAFTNAVAPNWNDLSHTSISYATTGGSVLTATLISPGSSAPTFNASATSFTSPTISWLPSGQTAPITMSFEQFYTLLQGLAARHLTLAVAKQTALNAIAACGTIAAVISFDVTAGWPF